MMIHTALVAAQSAALQSLVNGSMKEAQTGSVQWEGVDMETFTAFAEYIYTGEYTPLSHVEAETPQEAWVEDEKSTRNISNFTSTSEMLCSTEPLSEYWVDSLQMAIPEQVAEQPDEVLATSLRFVKRSIAKKYKTKYQEPVPQPQIQALRIQAPRFQDLKYPLPPDSLRHTAASQPRPNTSATEIYTPVFLGHASLYVFADKWGMEPFKAVVLYKLHKTLCTYTRYEARYGDIIELAEYTYDNTSSRSQRDPLRELVIQYVADEPKEIASSEQCMELVEKGGAFAKDLMGLVLRQIF